MASRQQAVVDPAADRSLDGYRFDEAMAGLVGIANALQRIEHVADVAPRLAGSVLTYPTPSLLQTVEKLERRLFWRPQSNQPLAERVLHVARGLLSLKEMENLRTIQSGTLSDRVQHLSSALLSTCESRYGRDKKQSLIPERVKEVRRAIIEAREKAAGTASKEQEMQWSADMDNMFLATQLYSYPGDYLEENPTIERMAETLDKLEEDALEAPYPTVHGDREVLVRFDQPIELPTGKQKRMAPAEHTDQLEQRVQSMLDNMNAQRKKPS